LIVIDSCGWIEFLADGPLAEKYAPYFARPDEIVTPCICYRYGVRLQGGYRRPPF